MKDKGFALAALVWVGAAFAQQPTFRTNTSIVPTDVRVVDKDGKPVTDLTKADFTVTDDRLAQTITQFEKQTVDGRA